MHSDITNENTIDVIPIASPKTENKDMACWEGVMEIPLILSGMLHMNIPEIKMNNIPIINTIAQYFILISLNL